MTLSSAGVPATTISDMMAETRISLRARDRAAIEQALGLALSATIGERTKAGQSTALCLGPDEWLICAPQADSDDLTAKLGELATRFALSAVDVSDREITFELAGPDVLNLLAAGCPRNLTQMPIGHGARTIFDTVQAILTREASDRFHLTVWRSFAPHVRAILDLAACELSAGL